jgi:hypothetical protein
MYINIIEDSVRASSDCVCLFVTLLSHCAIFHVPMMMASLCSKFCRLKFKSLFTGHGKGKVYL